MRKFLLALIAILTLALCGGIIGISYFLFLQPSAGAVIPPVPIVRSVNSPNTSAPSVAPAKSVAQERTATPGSSTPPPATPGPASDASTLDLLTHIDYPPLDRIQLGREFRGLEPTLATPAAPRQYKIGDKEQFWVSSDPGKSTRDLVTATLRYMNDVVYMWVQDGERVNDADLKKSADEFATKIYPTNHKYLGTEAIPGVDNDPHLHIVHARIGGGVAGYYGQTDTLPKTLLPQSNEREMFYISTTGTRPGTPFYNSVLAHEFAHMIQRYANERGEGSWISEGFGELATELNGYSSAHTGSFTKNPDLQLNAWEMQPPGSNVPHYGESYLFLSYQLNRFGIDYIRDVFASNTTGMASIQKALDKYAPGMTFDALFADWVAANFLNDQSGDKRYGYGSGELGIRPTISYSTYPASGSDTVHQYGTDYIQLMPGGKDVTFSFDGSDTVPVIPTDPHSGSRMWWSGRTDLSDTTLTRSVDLTGAQRATLKFWTWYDIEDDYDYAYVSVSTDGGKTWKTLKGTTTTDRDPNQVSYGNGFTCKSAVGCGNWQAAPQWVQEQMDLTPFAGKTILLRFEQVTDEAATQTGMAIDDIEIPEIGFRDDAETGDNGWNARGFALIDNVLPQTFIVQAIEYGATPKVVPIKLDAQNRATYTTKGLGPDVSRVVLTVSGSTPVTWETAQYQYQIQ